MKNNQIIIFDTTLRDGEQCPGASMNLREKLEVARQLERLKVDVIEAGFPVVSEGDFEAVETIAREIRGPVICGVARCVAAGICAARMAVEGVKRAKSFVDDVEFSPEDGSRTEPEFLVEICKAAIAAGATTLNIPDTVGWAVPEQYGALIKYLYDQVPEFQSGKAMISV